MKEMMIKELRSRQVNMVKYIAEICEKNNLKYFIFGGTLIGAIRHKGYIPWDDDVDIIMPFDDYKKLINLVNKEENNQYKILNPYEKNNNYYYMFSKMVDTETILIENNFKRINEMGVFVDIFPQYNLPSDEKELNKYYKKILKKEKIFFRNYGFENYYYSNNKIKKILKAILYYFEHLALKNKMEKKRKELLELNEKYNNIETDVVGNITPPCSLKTAMKKEIFSDSIDVEFEGIMVKAPVGYDEFLRKVYGDYMQLPPKEEQKTHHNFKVYYKEK